MKTKLHFLSIAFCLSAITVMAQPTLTAAGINPVSGEQFINVGSTYTSPGSAGANQTWNFAALTTNSTSTVSVLTASTTTYGASFPNANVATTGNGTSFEYYKTSAGAYQSYGSANASTTDSYTNPEDRLQFPFTYTNTYLDYFSSIYVSSGVTIYRSGNTNVTADAYGTLTTPAGTFSNVLRVYSVYMYHDSSNTSGNPSVNIFQRTQYQWYLNGNHTAIANVSTFTFTPATGSPVSGQGAGYLSNATTGINLESAFSKSISIFPNPGSGTINFSVALTESKKVEIKLFNSLGAVVLSNTETQGIAGGNSYKFDLASLPGGIYFAGIYLDGTLASTRKVIINN